MPRNSLQQLIQSPGASKALAKVKKPKRMTKPTNKRGRKATVGDPGSDVDELSMGHQARRTEPSTGDILDLLKKTTCALAEIDDLEKFFLGGGFKDIKMLKNLQNHCSTIAGLLPSTTTRFSKSAAPSTMERYKDRFILRAPNKLIYVMRAEEVFQGTKLYQHKKVLSWVEDADAVGLDIPLYSLPGFKQNAESHPRLLDPVVWQKAVKDFTRFHNFFFKQGQFDECKGEPLLASHNEPRLMLSYAAKLVNKHLGYQKPKQRGADEIWQLGYIYKLKDLGKRFHAVITQTRPPCKPCKAFGKWFEELSGIKFTFRDCRSMGFRPEKTVKNTRGYEIVPEYVSEAESEICCCDDKEDEESDSDWTLIDDHTIRSTSRVPVVELRGKFIPALPTPAPGPQTTPRHHNSRIQPVNPVQQHDEETTTTIARKTTKVQKQSSSGFQMVTTTATTQSQRIKSFAFNPNTGSKHTYFVSDSEDDPTYEPTIPISRYRPTPKKVFAPRTPPNSARKAPAASDRNPFGPEAFAELGRIKNKRRRERQRETSPQPAKNYKRSRRE